MRRLKFIASVFLSNVDKHTVEGENPVQLCNYTDVYYNATITDAIEFMQATASKEQIARFLLHTGDVLITKDSETANDIAVPAVVACEIEKLLCGYHLALLRPRQSVIGKYLRYVLASPPFRDHFRMSANGVTRVGLSNDDITSALALCPPSDDQAAIVAYLDRKTAAIERFITKKQQLIALLNEQKFAIFNQAVTKGLNPDMPMKESGVGGLDEVPAHWEIKRLKFLGRIRYGLGQPPEEKKAGLPLIRATNIERGRIVEKDMVYVNPDDVPSGRDAFLRVGEIVVVRSGAYTADSAVVPPQFDGSVVGYDMVFTPQKISPHFMAYALLSRYVLQNQLFLQRMRAAQPHLNKEELGEAIVLVPPAEEQKAIVSSIDTESYRISQTISRIEREIELIKEYRTTLISEVVTGKIDVREAVDAESAAANLTT